MQRSGRTKATSHGNIDVYDLDVVEERRGRARGLDRKTSDGMLD
jgi:hypothetical protein